MSSILDISSIEANTLTIKEEVYDIDLAITCIPGETVFIDTNDNLTFSHSAFFSSIKCACFAYT